MPTIEVRTFLSEPDMEAPDPPSISHVASAFGPLRLPGSRHEENSERQRPRARAAELLWQRTAPPPPSLRLFTFECPGCQVYC